MPKPTELSTEPGKPLTVYVTREDVRLLKALAWEQRVPVSELVRRAIRAMYGKGVNSDNNGKKGTG